ncbi:MAG: ATP-binding protein [Ignavibacteria bacterium]
MGSLSIEIESSRKNISRVEKVLQKANDECQLGQEKFNKLLIAVTEIVLNAIVHGNKEIISKKVKVKVHYDSEKMIVNVSDEGNGFDFESLPDPTLPENIYSDSGRGIFIARNLIDKMEYKKTRRGSEFILTVLK